MDDEKMCCIGRVAESTKDPCLTTDVLSLELPGTIYYCGARCTSHLNAPRLIHRRHPPSLVYGVRRLEYYHLPACVRHPSSPLANKLLHGLGWRVLYSVSKLAPPASVVHSFWIKASLFDCSAAPTRSLRWQAAKCPEIVCKRNRSTSTETLPKVTISPVFCFRDASSELCCLRPSSAPTDPSTNRPSSQRN